MNRAVPIIAALMMVVSMLILVTIIDSSVFVPVTGEKAQITQPLPTTAAPTDSVQTKPVSLLSGSFIKKVMTAYLPRAGAVLKVSIQPLRAGQLPPEKWQEWPVIPVVSERARLIYREGLKQGTNAQHFSKIGDCQVIRQYFLGLFDDDVDNRLGGSPYKGLLPTIHAFEGSWGRVSMSVRTGFNVASVLSPINSDPKQCKGTETPLDCEFRLWNPSIVVISMETWPAERPTSLYEGYLRQIVEYALARGVLPIVATKADNLEKDHAINLAVARVAFDYDIPLWNWWRVASGLPRGGLESDGFHLTNTAHNFNEPETMKYAWPARNISFVQAYEAVWRAVK